MTLTGGVAALVLAAGASTRMGPGAPKALAEVAGASMLERVLTTLAEAGVEPVVVLGPPHGERIRAALREAHRTAWNPRPELGMLSSVQVGLRALTWGAVRGALIWPVDVPLVKTATVRQLLEAAHAEPDGPRLVLPSYAERGGHPLWLPSALFAEALELPAGSTLRTLRERHPVLRVAVADPAVLRDVDTPADLAAAREAAGPAPERAPGPRPDSHGDGDGDAGAGADR